MKQQIKNNVCASDRYLENLILSWPKGGATDTSPNLPAFPGMLVF